MTRGESFEYFLNHFSKETLPITLSDDTIRHFSEQNRPLGNDSIRRFIDSSDHLDEDMTEYIACCIVPTPDDIHAIIYWKGTLMSYEYVLATYTKHGVRINSKVIAGIKSDGNKIKRSIATIDEDQSIQIIVGQQDAQERLYNPLHSQVMGMEIMPNGEIAFSTEE